MSRKAVIGTGAVNPGAPARRAPARPAPSNPVWHQLATTPARMIQRQVIPQAPGLGTSATTAPIATVSPQRQMNEELDRELVSIARARILLPWIDERMTFSLDDVMADAGLLAKLDLTKDKALRKLIYPFKGNTPPAETGHLFTSKAAVDDLLRAPASPDQIEAVLDLLHFHGAVLRLGGGDFMASVTRVEARIERDQFDGKSARIEQFAVAFKKRVARRDPVDPIVATEVLPLDWSAGTKKERKGEAAAVKRRQKLEQRLETAPEGPKREALEKGLAKAERGEARAKGFHTLAEPSVRLLERLRARNDRWWAGTYSRHWWGEFSTDVFLKAPLETSGFWKRSAVRRFFEDLNAACEESGPPGKFAWKAIYNDDAIRTEMNNLYGAGRVLKAPGHGPDKLHIHLDLRPLTGTKNDVTGYSMDQGHVVLPEPTP